MLRTACYDAEDRMVSETDVNGNTGTYTYDGNGLRVGKTVAGNTTTYVYDGFGYLAAEYSPATTSSPCGTQTCYPILDHLGSTRMLTDATGSNAVKRYDYLPFGQELLASINGRTTGMGYFASPDGSNPKFTGKNRDNETGFDWFEIRHMSGAQGRFQSVDPGNAGASLADPQTWNAYSYVGNNPLSYVDPSGMAGFSLSVGPVGGSSSPLWGLIGPAGALAFFGYDLFDSLFGGPESHPLPAQPAVQGVVTPGQFGLRINASPGGGSWGQAPYIIPGLVFLAQATGQLPRDPGEVSQGARLRIYCQGNVINAMNRAWAETTNGTSKIEAGFSVSGNPNGSYQIDYSKSSRDIMRTTISIHPNTFATFHVHPNGGDPWATPPPTQPNDTDPANGKNAFRVKYDVYTFGSHGLYAYRPGQPFEASRMPIRQGLSWAKPCE
jgi:RHS repeat-associated protein